MTTMQAYSDLVKEDSNGLQDIDIGLVFLNAGAVTIGPFDLISD